MQPSVYRNSSALCVGHILKMPLIFFLIMAIMPLYKAGLDAQIDHLIFSAVHIYIYISADSVWACIITRKQGGGDGGELFVSRHPRSSFMQG